MNDKYQKVQQSIKFEKEIRKVPEIPQPVLIDDAFWKIQEEENSRGDVNLDELVGKGLWITKLDSDIGLVSQSASLPVLPKVKSPAFKIEKKQFMKSSLEEQQEKHLKILQEKQPLGRDGKRIPLPAINMKRNPKPKRTSGSLQKTGEIHLTKMSGFY